ncbi:hypothetical protein [Chryseobacterium sediminis]|jgi:hypothetical protein|uniref:hypothetical protein n=1 Tax=Chryseobacterium sediminis TaxID=1679494 RepID=UPI00285D5269|nr:hypothetical protein [Chryseobacterium sediminis]MDR6461608.1 hypothetical protein [Chryseobacterium sediminis]
MNDKNLNSLSNLLDNKRKILELIVVSVFLGIGVSLVSSSIFELIKNENKIEIYSLIGLVLIFLSLIYLTINLFGKRKIEKEIDGFFILGRTQKNIINIDNYDYSNKIFEYLQSAITEEVEIKEGWLSTNFGDINDECVTALPYIQEISEYYFLESLSKHLSSFFNNTKFKKTRLKRYERNDIPDILVSNRFLELFSKPMQERSLFNGNQENNPVMTFTRDSIEGRIVSNYKNGAMFQYFDLKLPTESKINRKGNSKILISNSRFDIVITTTVSGVNTYISSEYRKLYLGFEKLDDPTFITNYKIEINFKRFSFLKSSSWEYYEWLDSFLEEFEKKVSEKFYFEYKIEWDRIYPIIKTLQK